MKLRLIILSAVIFSLLVPQGIFAASVMQQRCEPSTDCIVGEYVFADDGYTAVTTDNYCQITIRDPANGEYVTDTNMSDDNYGWHYYTFNAASPEGVYKTKICCDTGANKRCIDKTFVLGTSFNTLPVAIWSYTGSALDTAGNAISKVWSYTGSALDTAGNAVAKVWEYATRKLTSRQIGSGSEYIASQSDVQAEWTVYLSDFGRVLTGNTYRAKLWILNYASTPTSPYAVPTVTIYDASRNIVAENVSMTLLSTGIYEYTYSVSSSATQGVWETIASVEVESGKTIKSSDYWEVEGSPAQVRINSVSDVGVPSISANVIFTNEGLSGYEYQYEWCVVSSESNACGGGDDVAYSSAAKYLNASQSWTTDLPATVTNTGSYWFKVVIYYGTEASGASQAFTATASTSCGDGSCNGGETCSSCAADCGNCGGGGGGGGAVAPPVTQEEKPQNTWDYVLGLVTKILARLLNIETKTDNLNSSLAGLTARIISLENKTSKPIAVVSPQPVKTPTATKPSTTQSSSAKAKVRLESK